MILRPKDLERAQHYADAIRSTPNVWEYLNPEHAKTQGCVRFTHDASGILLTGYYDAMPTDDLIVDLKCVREDAFPRDSWAKQVYNQGYDLQAAIYTAGFDEPPDFAHAVVGKVDSPRVPPVALRRLGSSFIDLGWSRLDYCLEILEWCIAQWEWPADAEDGREIRPRGWMLRDW
jgi:hypothetical protein